MENLAFIFLLCRLGFWKTDLNFIFFPKPQPSKQVLEAKFSRNVTSGGVFAINTPTLQVSRVLERTNLKIGGVWEKKIEIRQGFGFDWGFWIENPSGCKLSLAANYL